MDERVHEWLQRDPDPQTRAALEQAVARGDSAELAQAFGSRLEFGTAGLRGILGAGPARMNRLVVRETTAGLATYLFDKVASVATRGVVIGYDARRGSRVFAEDAACVLAGCGIKAYLFERECPTPLCAFATRELGAAAGVMVTASHNPPEYNGYKVYWDNGAQIIPPHDAGIAAAILDAATLPLPWHEFQVARAEGRIVDLDDTMAERYLAGIAGLSIHPPSAARARLGIAYTPLHGVGARLAEQALARAGFTKVRTVASQREPDGAFPTVRFPNPEEPGAMDALVALAVEMKAELACANDPDADRLAVAVRRPDGTYRVLSGNEIGVLLGFDRLSGAPKDALVVTTIVSSRLLGAMAKARGAAYEETLTGFKWIANVGLAREAEGARFVFGYEEALGYTIGGLVRDKDGISALTMFAEMTAALCERGESVLDRLDAIAREFGLYATRQKSLALDPKQSATVGGKLRTSPARAIAGHRVLMIDDLLSGLRTRSDGKNERLTLPASDVLIYSIEGEGRVIVRPSGTEPKLKCYYELRLAVATGEPVADTERRAAVALDGLIAAHQRELAAALM